MDTATRNLAVLAMLRHEPAEVVRERFHLADYEFERVAHPERPLARKMVNNAVKSGQLTRPEICTKCGTRGEIQGHHPDYSKPLQVVWLCPKCHCEEHPRKGKSHSPSRRANAKRGDVKITEFENASGTVSLRVSGIVNGERRRENFSGPNAHAQALTVKQNWERERANLQPLPAVTTRLTPDQCAEAESGFHRLAGHALTMSKAIDFALANWKPSERACSIESAVESFLQHKKAQNCRFDTCRNLTGRLHLLVKLHGTAGVNELQITQIRPLIHRPGNSPQTVNNNRIALFGFFKWCVKEGYRADNPVSSFEPVNTDDREPTILAMPQILRLLRAAATERDAAMLPYVVLGLFCGIRPTELRRLSWDDVDLVAGTVTISGKLAKMRGRRIVSVSDNAAAFLLEHAAAHTPLVPANWRKDFAAVRASAGLAVWTADILRHTAISYHLGKHKDDAAAAAWAGNSADVIHRHYKGLVKAADVLTFWGITPASLDNILDLQAA